MHREHSALSISCLMVVLGVQLAARAQDLGPAAPPRLSERESYLRADTHNHAFWAPEFGKYVGISRGWPDRIRTVVRMESPDFTQWGDPVEVFRGPRETQTYSMPVFRHAGVYLGLASIYRETTDRRVHVELTWSPDTIHWESVEPGKEFIPLSPDPEAFDYGTIYAAATPVIEQNGDIRLYYGATQERHTSVPMTADVTGAVVHWQEGDGLEPFQGKAVSFRFEIVGAKLYAFRIAP